MKLSFQGNQNCNFVKISIPSLQQFNYNHRNDSEGGRKHLKLTRNLVGNDTDMEQERGREKEEKFLNLEIEVGSRHRKGN